ncbi:hypothetical protein OFO11_39455, partial [Escherichia coli]|nr:hypothetical protein [Escherichia coli]
GVNIILLREAWCRKQHRGEAEKQRKILRGHWFIHSKTFSEELAKLYLAVHEQKVNHRVNCRFSHIHFALGKITGANRALFK